MSQAARRNGKITGLETDFNSGSALETKCQADTVSVCGSGSVIKRKNKTNCVTSLRSTCFYKSLTILMTEKLFQFILGFLR